MAFARSKALTDQFQKLLAESQGSEHTGQVTNVTTLPGSAALPANLMLSATAVCEAPTIGGVPGNTVIVCLVGESGRFMLVTLCLGHENTVLCARRLDVSPGHHPSFLGVKHIDRTNRVQCIVHTESDVSGSSTTGIYFMRAW